MILIISSNREATTDFVETWLQYYHIDYYRINEFDKISIEYLTITNEKIDFILQVNEQRKIKYSEIKSVWYRRGLINIFKNYLDFSNLSKDSFEYNIEQYKKEELDNVHTFLFKMLAKKNSISNFNTARMNKLNVLQEAVAVGLNIPDSFLTTDFSDLKVSNFITKSAGASPIDFQTEHYLAKFYTTEVDKDMHSDFLSFLQKKIKKKYEIRTFYLQEELYSMAIFSQNDPQTRVDFRNYNDEKPNRTVPYKLAKDIEEKVIQLMNNLGLNTGSLDFLIDEEDKVYFLEVNPVGQFGMVSYPCNYFLEEKLVFELNQ